MSNTDLIVGPRDLGGVSTQMLKAELIGLVAEHVDRLVRMAAIVKELEHRGETLEDVRSALLPLIRKIAHGQLLPEVVVRYQGTPLLLDRISRLPLPDQRKCVGPEPRIEMYVAGGDVREVDPLDLPTGTIHQVFGMGQLRSLSEQRSYIDTRPSKPPKSRPGKSVRADRERGGIVIGRTFVPASEALRALASLSGDFADAERSETVTIKLTPDEIRRLRVNGAKSGHPSMAESVRTALYASGLMRPAD